MNEVSEQVHRPSVLVSVISGLGVAVLLAGGVLLLGRLADSDLGAMALTSVFFLAVMIAIGVISWRSRGWFLPLAIPFVLVAGAVTVVLGRPLVIDDVVNEQVVTADDGTGVTEVSTGQFVALSHPGEGTATLLSEESGTATLTLTDFATDNGPDVRVYLSRNTDDDGRGESFIDLGAMKGNRGNQQYAIPDGVDLKSFDALVLWCRAFDVGFTQAPLTQVAA
jgi:hypothetical protein